MPDLTHEQKRAFDWLREKGGRGVYRGSGVVMCGAEQAPMSRETLLGLLAAGVVWIERDNSGAMIVECR